MRRMVTRAERKEEERGEVLEREGERERSSKSIVRGEREREFLSEKERRGSNKEREGSKRKGGSKKEEKLREKKDSLLCPFRYFVRSSLEQTLHTTSSLFLSFTILSLSLCHYPLSFPHSLTILFLSSSFSLTS